MEKRNRENLALVLALCRSHQQFMRNMGPVFRKAKLTPMQWDVLETLSSKGDLSINGLMESVLSTSGNIDVVLRNLIEAGLVKKTRTISDRRSRTVSLTPAGHKKIDTFYPIHNHALAQLFSSLTSAEKKQHIKLLNHLRKNISLDAEKRTHDKQNTISYSCSNL